MREQLIRFLLGELDEDERRELRAELKANPELQRELEQLRSCFASNQEEDDDESLPPGSLAERTSRLVKRCDEDDFEAIASEHRHGSSAGEPPAGVLGWSLADLTVAGGVMLAVSMLVFPALRDSRDGTRLTMCERNQQVIYTYAMQYGHNHAGFVPPVLPNENAGILPVELVRTGVAQPEELQVVLICPASSFAGEVRSGRAAFRIPSRITLRGMNPGELSEVSATLLPCYAYRLPHKSGDGYVYLNYLNVRRSNDADSGEAGNRQLAFEPLLSDLANYDSTIKGSGHRGSVILVTGLDGSVRRFRAENPIALGYDNDIYHNDVNLIAAGLRPTDIVLASGNATPGLE
jgi:hypothetical protein